MSEHASSYKSYWILWVVLLTVTVTMIFIGESQISKVPQTLMLLVGSAIKASLIIFFYMHLRFEKMPLVLTVLVGIFLTSVLMFAVPAFDGGHILEYRLFK